MILGVPILLTVLSGVWGQADSQDPAVVERRDTVGGTRLSPQPLRTIEHNAFTVGERLIFDVGYGFIIAGEARMEIPTLDTVQGRECLKVTFRVNSTPSFSWIYKVEDYYETYLDRFGVFPWRFVQRIREGSFKRDFEADFDHVKNKARTTEGEYPIPSFVHDIVSAFYYVRTLDFSKSRVGEKVYLENFYKDKTYPLAVKFLGRQRIEVEAGVFQCILIEPLVKEGGLFKSEGRVIIWMTDDEKKIPVKVSTQILIGSIYAELREYAGVSGAVKAKVQ